MFLVLKKTHPIPLWTSCYSLHLTAFVSVPARGFPCIWTLRSRSCVRTPDGSVSCFFFSKTHTLRLHPLWISRARKALHERSSVFNGMYQSLYGSFLASFHYYYPSSGSFFCNILDSGWLLLYYFSRYYVQWCAMTWLEHSTTMLQCVGSGCKFWKLLATQVVWAFRHTSCGFPTVCLFCLIFRFRCVYVCLEWCEAIHHWKSEVFPSAHTSSGVIIQYYNSLFKKWKRWLDLQALLPVFPGHGLARNREVGQGKKGTEQPEIIMVRGTLQPESY